MRPFAPLLRSALCLCLVASTVAHAADRRVGLVVVPSRESLNGLTTIVDRSLRDGLNAERGVQLVDLGEVASADDTAREKANLAEGNRALNRAISQLEASSVQPAAQSVNLAITRFEDSDLEQAIEPLSRALAVSAAVSIRQGSVEAARTTLTRLYTLRPAAVIEPSLSTPPLRSLAQEVRSAIASKGRAALALRTSPPGASAFVDGVFVGVTPIELTSLTAGDHYLTVKLSGYATTQERFQLEDKLKLSLPLQPTSGGELLVKQRSALQHSPPNAALRSTAAIALARWAELDEVWLGRVDGRPGRYNVRVHRLSRDGAALGSAEAGFHEARMNGEETFRPIFTQLRPSPESLRDSGRPVADLGADGSSDGKWTKRQWSYVALGGGAALAATGLVFGIRAQGLANDSKNLPATDPTRPTVQDEARKSGRIADAFFIGAAAAGVTGAVLYFWKDERPESSSVSWSVGPTSGGAAASVSGSF